MVLLKIQTLVRTISILFNLKRIPDLPAAEKRRYDAALCLGPHAEQSLTTLSTAAGTLLPRAATVLRAHGELAILLRGVRPLTCTPGDGLPVSSKDHRLDWGI